MCWFLRVLILTLPLYNVFKQGYDVSGISGFEILIVLLPVLLCSALGGKVFWRRFVSGFGIRFVCVCVFLFGWFGNF
jgi:hypothetical protein